MNGTIFADSASAFFPYGSQSTKKRVLSCGRQRGSSASIGPTLESDTKEKDSFLCVEAVPPANRYQRVDK